VYVCVRACMYTYTFIYIYTLHTEEQRRPTRTIKFQGRTKFKSTVQCHEGSVWHKYKDPCSITTRKTLTPAAMVPSDVFSRFHIMMGMGPHSPLSNGYREVVCRG